jgi:hypothetical protein
MRVDEAMALVEIGRITLAADGSARARPCWQRALAIYTELDLPEAKEVTDLLARHPAD